MTPTNYCPTVLRFHNACVHVTFAITNNACCHYGEYARQIQRKENFSKQRRGVPKDSMDTIKERVASVFHVTGLRNHHCWLEDKNKCKTLRKDKKSNMASFKIVSRSAVHIFNVSPKNQSSKRNLIHQFAVLLLTTMIGTVLARPGHGSYIGHHTPISYSSYSYPHYAYSYPSYGYGHGLYSSYSESSD